MCSDHHQPLSEGKTHVPHVTRGREETSDVWELGSWARPAQTGDTLCSLQNKIQNMLHGFKWAHGNNYPGSIAF